MLVCIYDEAAIYPECIDGITWEKNKHDSMKNPVKKSANETKMRMLIAEIFQHNLTISCSFIIAATVKACCHCKTGTGNPSYLHVPLRPGHVVNFLAARSYIPINAYGCCLKPTFIEESPLFLSTARKPPRDFTSSRDSIEPSSPAPRAQL